MLGRRGFVGEMMVFGRRGREARIQDRGRRNIHSRCHCISGTHKLYCLSLERCWMQGVNRTFLCARSIPSFVRSECYIMRHGLRSARASRSLVYRMVVDPSVASAFKGTNPLLNNESSALFTSYISSRLFHFMNATQSCEALQSISSGKMIQPLKVVPIINNFLVKSRGQMCRSNRLCYRLATARVFLSAIEKCERIPTELFEAMIYSGAPSGH